MKKILTLAALIIVVVGCAKSETKADSEKEIYIESTDGQGKFKSYKLVDRETGCKFIVVWTISSGSTAISPLPCDK